MVVLLAEKLSDWPCRPRICCTRASSSCREMRNAEAPVLLRERGAGTPNSEAAPDEPPASAPPPEEACPRAGTEAESGAVARAAETRGTERVHT